MGYLVGQQVIYKQGTRMQRTGVVVAVEETGEVVVEFDHDATGDMSMMFDPADLTPVVGQDAPEVTW
jgi:hypothetical protein